MKLKDILLLIKASNGYLSKGLIIRDKDSILKEEELNKEREIDFITSTSSAIDESTIIIYVK